jgi:hypothetical protein
VASSHSRVSRNAMRGGRIVGVTLLDWRYCLTAGGVTQTHECVSTLS